MLGFSDFTCLKYVLVGALLLTACERRVPLSAPTPPITVRRYLDLQPGWRLRTITPILKSGKFKPELKETVVNGSGIELSAGDDLLGYETSFYAVTASKPSGVAVSFISAVDTIDGKTHRKAQPRARFFDFSSPLPFVRIIFLTRVSQADHNQAILAAASPQELSRLTEQVDSDPATYCKSQGESQCFWVPEGIALRAEKRDPAKRGSWIPAS